MHRTNRTLQDLSITSSIGETIEIANRFKTACRSLLISGPFVILICYHAATRTGQISPICRHLGGIMNCGFLWAWVV